MEALKTWNENSRIRRNSATSKLCNCWAIEAKALKLAFSITMTEHTYQELQETLKKERDILIQVSILAFKQIANFEALISENYTDQPQFRPHVY